MPVDTYITTGERLLLDSSRRAAVEVRLRLHRKNTSRQLLRRLSYTHPAKYSHISRVVVNTMMTKRLMVGLLLRFRETLIKRMIRTMRSNPVHGWPYMVQCRRQEEVSTFEPKTGHGSEISLEAIEC